jgi:peptide/nickel transport system substrate-binding protein
MNATRSAPNSRCGEGCIERRRIFLAGSAASASLPLIVCAKSRGLLKSAPQLDLAIPHSVWTTNITRSHGYLILDTLYGQSGEKDGFETTPQIGTGHLIENDGKC